MGRVTQSSQTTGGTTFPFTYSYNLAGALETEVYPTSRWVKSCYDVAGRVSGVSGTRNSQPTTYASAISYAPHGAIQSLAQGSGLAESWSYNNRLQPSAISVGTAAAARSGFGADLYYCADANTSCTTNNGNLKKAKLSILGVDQDFTYDTRNRLLTASESSASWSQVYNYDSYGNRYVTTGAINPFTPTVSTNFDTNNRLQIQGTQYDASGNQKVIGGYASVWDSEERPVSSSINNSVTAYVYDGDGKRVMKQSPGLQTVYVYDAAGTLVAEYSSSMITPDCTTCYLSHDQLGSTRLVTDGGGNVVSRHDYLPFGEEVPSQYGGRNNAALKFAVDDDVNQKFTGKERDAESGLDYFGARYYGSALGRWTSPDQLNLTDERIKSPSNTINKYVYGGNNPLKFIDPDGNDITLFYDPTTTGHIGLVAYDPAKGTGTFESFGPGPGSRGLWDRTAQTFGKDVDDPITNGHVSDFSTPDYFREHYATLTIATSPEVTEQVVNYINSHGDGKWNLYTNNCADACQRVLQQIKAGVSGGTPSALWTSLLRKYGKRNALTSLEIAGAPVGITGKEFGSPSKGIDPFTFIPLLALHCETTTVTFIENGKVTSTESHQNCHL